MLVGQNLTKSYKKRPILKGIDIELSPGELVGLLGPNGAGKTTLFNLLVGFIFPDFGKIFLNGKDITLVPAHLRAKSGIAFLPQEHTLFDELSTLENLLIFTELAGISPSARKPLAFDLLARFGLEEVSMLKAGHLSGGQKRRLEIARAMILRPKFLFLDEPFAGIDPIILSQIKNLLFELVAEGIGILITDHNVRETIRMVSKVYILSEGKILAKGDPLEVSLRPDVQEVYLGKDFL
ncbi:MAG: LPS export ABC transporter ATP-binding protein [Aquificaceae bacterium]|nr:LPS export ABC transporter ATP-binding protein [Aquificaceae bacterium]MDW8236915.1 LPS export ABC transporter ATP-binding protein [Aquificaceae bacterium]